MAVVCSIMLLFRGIIKPFVGQEIYMSEITNTNSLGIVKGYKVFSGKNALKPATSAALQRIRYTPGRWVRKSSDHGPFAVFSTLEQAKAFKNNGYGTQVREVDFIPSTEQTLWKKNPPSFSRNRGGRGYHAESAGVTERPLNECPEGTMLASEVFVHEEIIA